MRRIAVDLNMEEQATGKLEEVDFVVFVKDLNLNIIFCYLGLSPRDYVHFKQ